VSQACLDEVSAGFVSVAAGCGGCGEIATKRCFSSDERWIEAGEGVGEHGDSVGVAKADQAGDRTPTSVILGPL
jgi:hypothetical protein